MNRLDMRADRAKTLERQVLTNQTIRRRRRAYSDVTQDHSLNSVPSVQVSLSNSGVSGEKYKLRAFWSFSTKSANLSLKNHTCGRVECHV